MALAIQRRHVVVFALILVIGGGYLLYRWVDVSPEERIRQVIDSIFAAIGRADVDGVMEHVAPDYQDEGVDREMLRSMAGSFFESFGPTDVRVRNCDISAEGSVGVADLRIYVSLEYEGDWGGRMGRSTWRLSFVRYGKRWYVERISPVSVAGRRVRSLRGLARNIPSAGGF